jgi:hypothetical protein
MDTLTKKLSTAGLFYRMRDDWIRFILVKPKSEYGYVEKLVAIRIASSINPTQQAYVLSQERIAKDFGCGIRVVKSAVQKLKKENLIRAKRVKVEGFAKRFNSYELVPVELSGPF